MDREALEGWLADGLSLEQIGRLVERHPSTVAYWIKKHGLVPAGRGRHASRGDIARDVLERLVARELTTREIAAELGRSQTNIRYWLRRHDLRPIRSRGVPPGTPSGLDATALRACRRHGTTLFIRRRDQGWRCLRCRSEAVTDRRRRVKALLVSEAGGACAICGYSRCVGALEFHHLDPAQKSFDLGRVGVSLALDRARAEARKCALLCSNCHAEVEVGAADLPS